MNDNHEALNTLKELIGELEFEPESPLDSMDAIRIFSKAKETLQELDATGDSKVKGQVKKTVKELDKAENLVKMSTTLVGGRIAYTALTEFVKKMNGSAS